MRFLKQKSKLELEETMMNAEVFNQQSINPKNFRYIKR